MAIKLSCHAKQSILGSSGAPGQLSFRNLFTTPKLIICTGNEPLYAETAINLSQILITFPTIAWGTSTRSGYTVYLPKGAAVWSDVVGTTGVATFFRFYETAGAPDNGYAEDSGFAKPRIQGTVGADSMYDLVVADSNYVAGTAKSIDSFQLRIF